MAEGVYRLHVQALIRGAIQAENVLSYRFEDTSLFLTPGPSAFLNAIDTALTAKYTALLGTTDTLVRYRLVSTAKDGDPTAANSAYDKVKNVVGTRTVTDDLPPECCALLDYQTAHVGRSYRGWSFMFPSRRSISLGAAGWNMAEAYMLAVSALATELTHHLDGGSFWSGTGSFTGGLVIYSRTRRARGLTPYYEPVTGVTVNPHPTWLRSRRR